MKPFAGRRRFPRRSTARLRSARSGRHSNHSRSGMTVAAEIDRLTNVVGSLLAFARPLRLEPPGEHAVVGQLGPAEIASKRAWTYRHVEWLGQHERVELQMPAVHPFNPLPLLRLSVACAHSNPGGLNRHVCEALFHHVWRGGADVLDPARLQALEEHLPAHTDPQSEVVKTQLKQQTDEAIAAGVFGVPAFGVDDKLFWGFDALPMLRDYLAGHAWFDGPTWTQVVKIPAGLVRKK